MSTAASGGCWETQWIRFGNNDTRAFMGGECDVKAFRSLYLSWIQEVRRLADKWDYEHCTTGKG
jgi:hypothetical protein